MPLLFLARSKNHRYFDSKKLSGMDIWYESSARAWMDFTIFSSWLKKFDDYVSKTNGRRVALLLDNALAHGRLKDYLVLENIEVTFLPKNTTAYLQCLDADVIAASKRRYRRKQYERALPLLERANTKQLYNVNLLQAMNWICSIWEDINPHTIYNC